MPAQPQPQRSSPRYRGVFPVVPTTFDEQGALDLASQKRCLDFMIDAGSEGLCILANFSEQFLLSDEEREVLTRTALEHVAGRVPVIVTTTHTSTKVCAERSRRAQEARIGSFLARQPQRQAREQDGPSADGAHVRIVGSAERYAHRRTRSWRRSRMLSP